MKRILLPVVVLLFSLACESAPPPDSQSADRGFTHGPILGRVGSNEIGVWARTSGPNKFLVRYGTAAGQLDQTSDPVQTTIDHDNTGWVHIRGLQPDTKYYYEIALGEASGPGGSFQTLPSADVVRDAQYNPEGLFNFRFEFACGNNQRTGGGSNFGSELPAFATMLRHLQRDNEQSLIDFAILNGDWLYEEQRDYSPEAWREQVELASNEPPRIVELAPSIVGVWENYKLYLSRAENLAAWHRTIPSFFTFDDHEIVNDVYGSGEVGRQDRRAVFRDIGVRAWYDYLGWSNPIEHTQALTFGRAELQQGSDVLTDASADFGELELDQAATLHVHWGTPDAGVMQGVSDEEGGDPNSGVYEIVEVLDANRLKIRPAARADGTASYSIGQMSHFRKRISNVDLFFVDTRTFRQMHDVHQRAKKGVTMLGARQKEWLKTSMRESDADFFFVVSSVNLTIPHVGGTGPVQAGANKDDAWTAFLDEREEMLRFWDGLGKPVFVLTGDLHNSFAIKISDRVWEFASGPHNSANHPAVSEGGRPANGIYDSFGRKVDIRWSSYIPDDTPQALRSHPVYSVVQVNNVMNVPVEEGTDRWVAFPRPHIVFQYYSGLTGELLYAEPIGAAGD